MFGDYEVDDAEYGDDSGDHCRDKNGRDDGDDYNDLGDRPTQSNEWWWALREGHVPGVKDDTGTLQQKHVGDEDDEDQLNHVDGGKHDPVAQPLQVILRVVGHGRLAFEDVDDE